MERTPSKRQAPASTRTSRSALSQHCARWVLTQSAASPLIVSTLMPSSGALSPELARQTISPFRSSAIAAPLAEVVSRACSTISFKTRSSARSDEESPPPLAASVAVNSDR